MINLTREEAQQVLDAFLGIEQRAYDAMSGDAFHECSIAVSRLRARLEQPDSKAHLQFSGPMHVVCKCEKCIAQPEPEPLGWIVMHEGMNIDELRINEVEQIGYDDKPMPNQYRVYTAPPQRKECLRCGEVNPAEIHTCTPQREWQGLTDEEMAAAWSQSKGDVLYRLKPFASAIEFKLKEKNAPYL